MSQGLRSSTISGVDTIGKNAKTISVQIENDPNRDGNWLHDIIKRRDIKKSIANSESSRLELFPVHHENHGKL